MSAPAAPADTRAPARPRAAALVAARDWSGPLWTIAFAVVAVAVVFRARGGLQLGANTTVELGADLAAGLAGIAAVLAGARTRRAWGLGTLAVFGLLAALTACSILWAVDPAGAWNEANRTIAHVAVLGLGIALVRLAPARWGALLGGVALAAVGVSGYALLTKVFPGSLAPDEVYARLRQPFGYWNAVGLLAAMGVPACVWLGARRTGHGVLNALAYPATGLLLATILLAYSRGSLLALAVGLIVWFALVPLRLRGAAVLGVGAVGALLVALWAFGQDGLSKDRAGLAERAAAGHEFGLLVLAMLAALTVAGLAIGFATATRAPSLGTRRQLGAIVLLCLAVVPVAGLTALALSQRGLGGSISKGWNDLTDPRAGTVSNSADRLTAVGSVRARYWDEALRIFRDNELAGVGADGYATVRKRYRIDTLDVRHAHGYIVQTAADLGIAGLAVTLALLAAFLAAALRTVAVVGRARRTTPFTPERAGLLTLLAIVVVFGVHSFVDWTWFVPGTAMLALLCAGWLVGRGPVGEALEVPRGALGERLHAGRRDRALAVAAGGLAVLVVAAMWQTWQPQRSSSLAARALQALDTNHAAHAQALVRDAGSANPLSLEPLFDQAAIMTSAGDEAGARRTLVDAVRMQPGNPDAWLRLAEFELPRDPSGALRALGPALYLDPRSPTAQQLFLDASRAEGGRASPGTLKKPLVGAPAGSGGEPGVQNEGTATAP